MRNRDFATGIDIGGGIGIAAGTAGIVTSIVLFATAPSGPQSKEPAPDEWQIVPVVIPSATGAHIGMWARF